MALEAICLAYATAHRHAVDGMPQPFFRHRDKELDCGITAAPWIVSPNGSYRKCEGRFRPGRMKSAVAEELLYGHGGTKFFFFVKPERWHGGGGGECHSPSGSAFASASLFSFRKRSRAPVIEGALGDGASRSRRRPASRTACAVVAPKQPMHISP